MKSKRWRSLQGYIYFQGTYNFSPTPFSEGSNSSLAIERLAFFFDKRRGLKTSFGEEYMDFPFLALERITFSVAIFSRNFSYLGKHYFFLPVCLQRSAFGGSG